MGVRLIMDLSAALDIARAGHATDAEMSEALRVLAGRVHELQRHVDAARALHHPNDVLDCVSCGSQTEDPTKWPCPTARALGRPRLVTTVKWEDPA